MMKKVAPETSCTAYMYDEKYWSTDFSYSLYIFTWPVEPIYIMKEVAPETSPTADIYDE
jgi:hypothetical protein